MSSSENNNLPIKSLKLSDVNIKESNIENKDEDNLSVNDLNDKNKIDIRET